MDLLGFLKSNISDNSTFNEVISTFKEMCETPIEDDLLLLEYGVYDFTGDDLFYFDLVRQYSDGEGEYYQLRVSLVYEPDNENRQLNDTMWSDDTDKDFFDFISKSDGFDYAQKHVIKSVNIQIDQT